MYDPIIPNKWQMLGRICHSFCRSTRATMRRMVCRDKGNERAEIVVRFRASRCCWSLPDKIMLPQVSGNSCYSHRVAEQFGNPMSCRWSDLYLATYGRIADAKATSESGYYVVSPNVSSTTCIATAIISIMTDFLSLFYHRNVHPIPQQTQPSERFDSFFICLHNSV